MEAIQSFAANFLSYLRTKHYYNWSTNNLVIVKTKRVNVFWNTVSIRVSDVTAVVWWITVHTEPQIISSRPVNPRLMH